MRRLVYILTLVVVAIHLISGCCAHHVHATEWSRLAGKPPGQCHGHTPWRHERASEPADHDSEDSDCDEASCVFMSTNCGGNFGLTSTHLSIGSILLLATGALPRKRDQLWSWFEDRRIPLRRYLVNQTFLL